MVSPPSTHAELMQRLAATAQLRIVDRMRAVYGDGFKSAFAFGDWRGVDFRSQDLRGVSLRSANLLQTKWDANSDLSGADLREALIPKAILAARGLDSALRDGAQDQLIAQWSGRGLPFGIPSVQLPPGDEIFGRSDHINLIREAPDFATAAHWLLRMREAGQQVDNATATVVVAKRRLKELETAIRAVVNPMIANRQADLQLLSAAIGNVDHYAEAKYWFDQIEVLGLFPNLYSFNGLLRRSGYDRGIKLIEQMIAPPHRPGRPANPPVTPDYHSFNPVIHAAPDLDKAISLFDSMVNSGLPARMVDFYALFFVARGSREIERVRRKLAVARKTPDIGCFNRMIHGAENIAAATVYWTELTQGGLDPDSFTASAMLARCYTIDECAACFRLMRRATIYPTVHQALDRVKKIAPRGRSGLVGTAIDLAYIRGLNKREVLGFALEAAFPDGRGRALFNELF